MSNSGDDLKVLATAGLVLTDNLILHEVSAKTSPDLGTLVQIMPPTNVKKALEAELQELKPFSEEFAKPNVRRKIDDAFNEMLGTRGTLDVLYRLLACDPTVTAQPLR